MKDHARQALGFKTKLIVSRLEQDEYYSLMKEIILLFANTHHSINAILFCYRFCSKNVGCLWGVACYVLWSCMV